MRGLALALALLALAGCGGPPQVARGAVSLGAVSVQAVDLEAEHELDQVTADYEAGLLELDSFETEVEDWARVVRAAEAAASTLRAAEASLDAWEAGADDGSLWGAVAPCVAAALAHVVDAVEAAGADPPELLRRAATLAEAFGRGCGRSADG